MEEIIPPKERQPTAKMTVISDIVVKNRLGGGHFSDVYKGEWQVMIFST